MNLFDNLPDVWTLSTLGAISNNIQYGLTQRATNDDSGILFLRITDIDDDGNVNLANPKYVSSDLPDLQKYILTSGDIVIARSGSVGRGYVYMGSDEPWVFASYLIRFQIKQEIVDPEYVGFFLRSPQYRHFVETTARGVAVQNINSKQLSSLPIPLPPRPEQQRIVTILRQADNLRRQQQAALAEAQKLIPAIFYEMFGDPVKNPKEWAVNPLDKLGVLDRGRSRHRPRDASHLFGGKYPFIQTGDVANADGWIIDYSQTYSEAGLEQSRLWPSGTLCITIAANIANTGILTFDACFPDSVVGFIPGTDVTVEYVRWWFVAIRNQIEAIAPFAAQKNINLQILRSLRVPTPPKALQEEFTDRTIQVQEWMNHQKQYTNDLEKLFNAFLTQSFLGELTQSYRIDNQDMLAQVAIERDILLGQRQAVAVGIAETQLEGVALTSTTQQLIKNRPSLWKTLSIAQQRLLEILHDFGETYFTPQIIKAQEGLQDLSLNAINRTFDLFEKLGLLVRVSLPVAPAGVEYAYFETFFRLPTPTDQGLETTAEIGA